MAETAIVTGGSSGIGLAAARALRDRGLRVYVLSRRPYTEKGLHHICADVSDEQQCAYAVQEVLRLAGDFSLLVNCAGFGISGAIEFTELADAKKQMDVNFFGTVNLCKAVLPHLRKRGGGRIEVHVKVGRGIITFQVKDNGKGMTKEELEYAQALLQEENPTVRKAMEPGHSGFGLRNVDMRIRLFYQKQKGLNIRSDEGGTEVSFTIPSWTREEIDHDESVSRG